ncbi:MAG TPA: metallophosphoesterase [Solirubrobacterales bacterium]|nr:metallophosphoesterase [Solirubrobacterales bacterium]
MRTAIVSDLHLGLLSGGDLARDPGVRALLLEEIAGADRVVLLGDVVELRELAIGAALAAARPFFEELGAALGGRQVVLVPGNHDHHLAQPLLDDLSLDGTPLGLAHQAGPSPGPTVSLDRWLGPAQLRVSYPGIWVRDDVYATHGHYMDAHLNLPRAECLAVATLARLSRPVPDPASAEDYERVMRPIYGFAYGVAQARRDGRPRRRAPSETAWRALASRGGAGLTRRRRLGFRAARAGFPVAVGIVNHLLRSDFDSDISVRSIFEGGVAGAGEVARRLGVDGGHVITGHSHRAGPNPDEPEWELPGGGRLHNTGSWVFSSVFHRPGRPPNSYWPGTVTWVEDDAPPRRVQLLGDHQHPDIAAIAAANATR